MNVAAVSCTSRDIGPFRPSGLARYGVVVCSRGGESSAVLPANAISSAPAPMGEDQAAEPRTPTDEIAPGQARSGSTHH
jgi:hypothetical protein